MSKKYIIATDLKASELAKIPVEVHGEQYFKHTISLGAVSAREAAPKGLTDMQLPAYWLNPNNKSPRCAGVLVITNQKPTGWLHNLIKMSIEASVSVRVLNALTGFSSIPSKSDDPDWVVKNIWDRTLILSPVLDLTIPEGLRFYDPEYMEYIQDQSTEVDKFLKTAYFKKFDSITVKTDYFNIYDKSSLAYSLVSYALMNNIPCNLFVKNTKCSWQPDFINGKSFNQKFLALCYPLSYFDIRKYKLTDQMVGKVDVYSIKKWKSATPLYDINDNDDIVIDDEDLINRDAEGNIVEIVSINTMLYALDQDTPDQGCRGAKNAYRDVCYEAYIQKHEADEPEIVPIQKSITQIPVLDKSKYKSAWEWEAEKLGFEGPYAKILVQGYEFDKKVKSQTRHDEKEEFYKFMFDVCMEVYGI